jgi:hypothetical protein
VCVSLLPLRRETRRGTGAPAGVRPFVWMMMAAALWCATSGLHALAPTLGAKLFPARLQYVGICGVAPLWSLFTSAYARGGSAGLSRHDVAALWVIPAVTVALAGTNEWHRAIWSGVSLDASGRGVYAHGCGSGLRRRFSTCW